MQSLNQSDIRYYYRVYHKEPIVKIDPFVIKKNDVILGCNTPVYKRENTVTLNVKKFNDDGTTNALSFLIIGRQGTGKSYEGSSIGLDNIVTRFGEKLFIYDPKGEYDKHKNPSYENEPVRKGKVDKYLNSINLSRKGYKIYTIAPVIAGKNTKVDLRFSITFADIMEIYQSEPTEALKIIIELIGLKSQPNTIDLVRELIEGRHVKTFKEMQDKSEAVSKKLNLQQTQSVLERKLGIAIRSGLLSDEKEKGIDILNILKENEVVIYKGKLKLTGSDTDTDLPYNAALKLVMLKIILDCALYFQGNSAAVVKSRNGVCFMLDEIDVLADESSDSSTRIFVTNILTKYRAFKIDFIGIGQEASRIYHELFSQVKVVLTSQVTSANASMLKERHVDKEYLDSTSGILGQLKLKVKTDLDTYVSEWVAIDEDNRIIPFYPLPPLSDAN